MIVLALALVVGCAPARGPRTPPLPPPTARASDPSLAALLAVPRADDTAYARLRHLCDHIGPRPAGSAAYDAAAAWSRDALLADGLSARLEPLTLTAWERGEERVALLTPIPESLNVLSLGNSGSADVTASVVVVRSFDELGPAVRGKIVLFDVAMAEGVPTHSRYGDAAKFRGRGPSAAATHGAVAALVRSVTTRSLDTPHTGGTWFAEGVAPIPALAVPTESADRIARLVASGVDVRAHVVTSHRVREGVPSANVVAEIPGRTPEVVLIGAHLDSWDVGCGAHDDGAGVVHVLEAMRRMKALGAVPERTVRAVLFSNEERGLDGGKAYAAAHGGETHAAAIETDLGGGRPLSWGATADAAQGAWLRAHGGATGLPIATDGGGGADLTPLEEAGVLVVGLLPDDTHYFDVHHTRADTFDKINRYDLESGAAHLAGLAWALASAPDPAPPRRAAVP